MQITFLGATEEVTGSCYLIKTQNATVLLECGQLQGERSKEEQNRQEIAVDVDALDAVVISHAHIDHSGRLPLLVKQGYSGPIYTHQATRALCGIMLLDSGYIHEKDAEWENKKRRKRFEKNNNSKKEFVPVEPLYTKQDAEKTIPLIRGLEYDEKVEVAKNLFIRLNDAGHILGSAIVEIWDESSPDSRKLVFSGDLGFHHAPLMPPPDNIQSADMVIMESTYGDRLHRSNTDTLEELKNIFKQAHADKGNVLIPSFAVGRSQDLLLLMAQHYKEWELGYWDIYLDSPLAIRATELYSRFRYLYKAKLFDRDNGEPLLPNLNMTMSTEESSAINFKHSGAIIIAGSGMCSGGRIHHHLKHNIWKQNTHLVFVGFQAYGTLGRMIVDGADQIKLWGQKYDVKAQIHTIGGLSAHADQDGLVDWYSRFQNSPPLYLVHGEKRAQVPLKERIIKSTTANVHIPAYGVTVDV
jgi:metallo-beta-lactamase family protein